MNNDVKSDAVVSEFIRTLPVLDIFSERGFDEAQLLVNEGRVADALNVYSRIGGIQAERHYQDAFVLEQRNDIQGAIGLLKKSASANPDHFDAWMKLANFLSGLEAEKACRAALNLVPGNYLASIRLASLLIGRNHLQDAAEVLVDAAPFVSNDYDQLLMLANLWWQLGVFPEAERYFRRCIQINREDVRPYQLLLELLNRLDRIDDAEQLCRDYLMVKPADNLMRANLIQVLVRQQRWDKAEAGFIELLTEFPGWVQLRQLYADMLEKCGRSEEALSIHEMNVKMVPELSEGYLQLADIQHNLGQKDAALLTLQRVCLLHAKSGSWGLNLLPYHLTSRLIFNQMENISERFCTGKRALVDNTGLNLTQSEYALGEVVELFCMVVGQEHIEYLEHIAYPSLSSTEGFDRLLKERKVIYNIYTTPADFKLLQGFLAKLDERRISYRVNVELLAFSQDLYSILALPIIDQVKRSLALQSAVVMALPDAIISGSIYQVLNDMKPSETVVCAMPRIDSVIACPELEKYFANATNKGLDSREFVRRSMTDFMHPQTYLALQNDSNCLRYRDEGTYYAARNWCPPPLCFYAREEMLDHMIRHPLCGPNATASFYAIDHDFVDSAYRTNNLRLIKDSDYFFWAELTHPARHNDFLSGRQSEKYYYPESTKHVFQHEFKWVYSG